MRTIDSATTAMRGGGCTGDCSRCPCMRLLAAMEMDTHREMPIGRSPRLGRSIRISRAQDQDRSIRISRASHLDRMIEISPAPRPRRTISIFRASGPRAAVRFTLARPSR